MATFSTKSLHFPGEVPKKQKKKQRFWICQDSKIFDFFVFFGTFSGNGNVFHQKLAFSWRGTKKNQKKPKILDSGLAFAKTLKSLFFLVFLVPPPEMATFSTKSLHFPGGVPKNQKNQILDSSALTFAKTLKSLFFLVFLVPPQEMATFSTKSLHFPGEVPKKPKKTKDFGLRPHLRQDSKIFVFFGFFSYLFRKWQRFPPKACIFLEGYQKNKKKQRFWTLQASPSPRL